MTPKPAVRRKLYKQNKESGNCPRCGTKKKKSEKHSYCGDCRAYYRDYFQKTSVKQNESRKEKYLLRKENRQCPRCGKKHGKNYSKIICKACLAKAN